MSTEDLLKPRYKVIADYPKNKRQIDEVIIMDKVDLIDGNYTSDGYMMESFYQDYPHLFKPLFWWEDRKPEDMPQYVKDEKGVYKVQEWHLNLASKVTVFINPKIHKGYIPKCTECPLYSEFLPSTEQEYNEWLNKQLQK